MLFSAKILKIFHLLHLIQKDLLFLQLHSLAESPKGRGVGATFMEKSVCLRSSATTRKLRNFTNRSWMWQWVNAHGGCIISCCGLSYIYLSLMLRYIIRHEIRCKATIP